MDHKLEQLIMSLPGKLDRDELIETIERAEGMIRKMKEKLSVVQDGHHRMLEQHNGLHALLVKSQQKCDAITYN